jgi:oxygen-independent coproporphyrinogen-3 oxidase
MLSMKKIESLYLHFPFCRHLCNYCDFYKKVPQNRDEEFSDFHRYFEKSFLEHKKLMEKNGYSWVPLKTLYIGGGTPSLWGMEGKVFLQDFLTRHQIELASDCEFTLEVNPGSWTAQNLEQWESIGVNRYSLGIQSMDGQVIKTLDRVHTIDDVYETLEYFHKKNVNFSVDFMLGLPFSDTFNRDIINELERVLKFKPFHFSVYILTVKNNYTHYEKLPNEIWVEKEYLDVSNFLQGHGYEHYEVSNFGLPGYASKHNLSYWQSKTVAALGPSATGFFAEDKIRYKWKTKDAVMDIEILDPNEYKLEELYMSLRSAGLNLKKLSQSNMKWHALGQKWVGDGLALIDKEEHLKLTAKGYLLLDSLMNDIFLSKLD